MILDLAPMESEAVDELPAGPGWQYEPKYDGFRCLAHLRDGRVHLQSKNQKPLERYFPEGAGPTIALKTCHVAMLDLPFKVVDVIADAAGEE